MKNIVKLKAMFRIAGIIAMAAVIVFTMAACGEKDSDGGDGIDSAAFAQLEGQWRHDTENRYLKFSHTPGYVYPSVMIEFRDGTYRNGNSIESLTKDKVSTVGDDDGGNVISFNFSVSGNKLAITNWSGSSYAAEYNGTYTKW
jgi:hypothetical protein